jgi:photosystem II stability/assembly factor-like uncharacterized protein
LLSGQNLFADFMWVIERSSGGYISGARDNFIYTSKDGAVWSNSGQNTSNLIGVMSKPVESNGAFVGIAQAFLLSSSDGIHWAISLNASYYNLNSFSLVSSTKNGFLVSGVGPLQNEFFVSNNGFKWTRLDTNVTSSLRKVISLTNIGLLLGVDANGWLWVSSDEAITWQRTVTFLDNEGNPKISPWLVSSNYIVWLGLPFLYASPLNGNAIINNVWERQRWRGSFTWIDSTVFQKKLFVLHSATNSYAVSTDGLNWSVNERTGLVSGQLNSIVADSTQLVAVGNTGLVMNAIL